MELIDKSPVSEKLIALSKKGSGNFQSCICTIYVILIYLIDRKMFVFFSFLSLSGSGFYFQRNLISIDGFAIVELFVIIADFCFNFYQCAFLSFLHLSCFHYRISLSNQRC